MKNISKYVKGMLSVITSNAMPSTALSMMIVNIRALVNMKGVQVTDDMVLCPLDGMAWVFYRLYVLLTVIPASRVKAP
jgi:hypothetical protein